MLIIIRFSARFRPVSPTSLCAMASGEINCRTGPEKPLLTLDYQKIYSTRWPSNDKDFIVSKMTESLYE